MAINEEHLIEVVTNSKAEALKILRNELDEVKGFFIEQNLELAAKVTELSKKVNELEILVKGI